MSAIVGRTRVCRTCGDEKHHFAFAGQHRVCNVCRAEANKARQAESKARYAAKRREQTRVAREARQAAKAAEMASWREQRAAEQADTRHGMQRPVHDRFGVTLAQLEAHWRTPYAQWTRAQHAQHSALLRERAGVPEDHHPWMRRSAA